MNTLSTSIHSFKTVNPLHQSNQNELIDWITGTHFKSMQAQNIEAPERIANVLRRFCVSDKQIANRYYEVDRDLIYSINSNEPSGKNIFERNLFFNKRAVEVMGELYEEDPAPDHLIHVTCTGYLSPSAPQIHFNQHPSPPEITHAYHMGCYASLPAVRMGQAFSAGRNQNVEIVHTEMCSLHLDPSQQTPEQMVVQTLFADGHIKYGLDQRTEGRRLEIKTIKEQIIPDSSQDMTWIPSPVSMQMTLSKEVPDKIRTHINSFVHKLSGGYTGDILFAIHPGGPKIIDTIQKQLELSDEQLAFSRQILKSRGNMSSATLPHIWKEILDSDYNGKVISLAFGPGLTIFGGLFETRK